VFQWVGISNMQSRWGQGRAEAPGARKRARSAQHSVGAASPGRGPAASGPDAGGPGAPQGPAGLQSLDKVLHLLQMAQGGAAQGGPWGPAAPPTMPGGGDPQVLASVVAMMATNGLRQMLGQASPPWLTDEGARVTFQAQLQSLMSAAFQVLPHVLSVGRAPEQTTSMDTTGAGFNWGPGPAGRSQSAERSGQRGSRGEGVAGSGTVRGQGSSGGGNSSGDGESQPPARPGTLSAGGTRPPPHLGATFQIPGYQAAGPAGSSPRSRKPARGRHEIIPSVVQKVIEALIPGTGQPGAPGSASQAQSRGRAGAQASVQLLSQLGHMTGSRQWPGQRAHASAGGAELRPTNDLQSLLMTGGRGRAAAPGAGAGPPPSRPLSSDRMSTPSAASPADTLAAGLAQQAWQVVQAGLQAGAPPAQRMGSRGDLSDDRERDTNNPGLSADPSGWPGSRGVSPADLRGGTSAGTSQTMRDVQSGIRRASRSMQYAAMGGATRGLSGSPAPAAPPGDAARGDPGTSPSRDSSGPGSGGALDGPAQRRSFADTESGRPSASKHREPSMTTLLVSNSNGAGLAPDTTTGTGTTPSDGGGFSGSESLDLSPATLHAILAAIQAQQQGAAFGHPDGGLPPQGMGPPPGRGLPRMSEAWVGMPHHSVRAPPGPEQARNPGGGASGGPAWGPGAPLGGPPGQGPGQAPEAPPGAAWAPGPQDFSHAAAKAAPSGARSSASMAQAILDTLRALHRQQEG